MASQREVMLAVAGREVRVSNPAKVYFPEAGITKLEIVQYYLGVAEGALRGAGGRPNVLVRYADGIHGEFFYQKRAPASRPDWVEVVVLRFPSGRTAGEVVPRDAAALAWMANLGCLELHPHPVRADDLDRPRRRPVAAALRQASRRAAARATVTPKGLRSSRAGKVSVAKIRRRTCLNVHCETSRKRKSYRFNATEWSACATSCRDTGSHRSRLRSNERRVS